MTTTTVKWDDLCDDDDNDSKMGWPLWWRRRQSNGMTFMMTTTTTVKWDDLCDDDDNDSKMGWPLWWRRRRQSNGMTFVMTTTTTVKWDDLYDDDDDDSQMGWPLWWWRRRRWWWRLRAQAPSGQQETTFLSWRNIFFLFLKLRSRVECPVSDDEAMRRSVGQRSGPQIDTITASEQGNETTNKPAFPAPFPLPVTCLGVVLVAWGPLTKEIKK